MKKLFCLAAALLLALPASAADWSLVEEAYIYALPLVMTDATMRHSTDTTEPGNGKAPINQFCHAKDLADANFKTVVTPNVDTLYTQAWLDLSAEPMVYVVPEADRFLNVQVLDAWTNTPKVINEPGAYAIALKSWKGELPEGVTRIDVPTASVWTIARVVLDGKDDLPNVYAIQDRMKLMPLSYYVSGEDYPASVGASGGGCSMTFFRRAASAAEDTPSPVEQVKAMSAQEFFGIANNLMLDNPPASDDADIINKIAAINVGPGLNFDAEVLGEDYLANWKNMLDKLPAKLVSKCGKFSADLGQWKYYGEPIGNF